MIRLILIGLLYCIMSILHTAAADTKKPQEKLSVAQVKADFEQLYQGLQAGSYDLYVNHPKLAYDQDYQRMLHSIQEPMTSLEVQKLFMRFTALADIAHTRIDFPVDDYRGFMTNDGKTLPLTLTITDTSVVIDDYLGQHENIQSGDHLIAVDGTNVRQWLAQLGAYIAADDQFILNSLLGGQVGAYTWLHDGERDSYLLRARSAQSGEVYEVRQPTLAYSQQQPVSNAEADASSLPRDYDIIDSAIGYLKPGPFYNVFAESDKEIWDTEEYVRFIDEAYQHFLAEGVDTILIDVRNNPGGTNSFSDPMIAWFADRPFKFASDFRVKVSELAKRANQARLENENTDNTISHKLAQFYAAHEPGEIISFPLEEAQPNPSNRSILGHDIDVYIAIDRSSYSNAVSVAAIAQDYGFATVIGETTADFATTYASMESFRLDHSGISVGFPKAHIIRPNGDLTAGGVVPDIQLNLESSLGNTTTALDKIISAIHSINDQR